MKDLPNVSAFPIDKKLDNAQERFSSMERKSIPMRKGNITSKINDIFASSNHVYKSRVRITLKDDIQERTIIGKTNTELLTLTGDKISIIDIVDIEKI